MGRTIDDPHRGKSAISVHGGDQTTSKESDDVYTPTGIASEELTVRPRRRGLEHAEMIFIGIIVGAVVVVALTLGLVFGLRTNQQTVVYVRRTPPPTPSPTVSPPPSPPVALPPTPAPAPHAPLSFSLSTQQGISESFSPQYWAHNWLMSHPNSALLPLWQQQQLFAMATLYYNLCSRPRNFGKDWLDYTKSECEWYSTLPGDGGPCNDLDRFEILDIRYTFHARLGAGLPLEIELLAASLKIVRLGGNHIEVELDQGFVAPLLPLSSTIQELSLVNNQVFGSIPTHIGKLTQLEVLKLGSNQISGSLPSELGLLTKLRRLMLQNNAFTGSLPSELGLLTSLEVMDVSSNTGLNGSVPKEVQELMTLQKLKFLKVERTNIDV